MNEQRHVVGKVSELPPGSRKIIQAGMHSIGVFNVNGDYHAIMNRCPHQAGPLCMGNISGTMLPAGPGEYIYGLEGRVLRCPWHGWEFDITTGEMIFVPDPMRVRTYEVAVEPPVLERFPVRVEEEMVVVYVGRRR